MKENTASKIYLNLATLELFFMKKNIKNMSQELSKYEYMKQKLIKYTKILRWE